MTEALTFDDVLIIPQYSTIESRNQCKLNQSDGFLNLEIPIIASNMDTITGPKMHNAMLDLGGAGFLHRYMTLDEIRDFVKSSKPLEVFVSVGTINSREEKEKIDYLTESRILGPIFHICVDIAHGHSLNMVKTLEYIRLERKFTGTVIAGNVVTQQAAITLRNAGANIVKVGIGSGSVCTTRIVTGCGFPQLGAISDCAKSGVPIIADGGLKTPGDCAKALAAGATYVMIGGMLAGTDCTPHWDKYAGQLLFRGMASLEAKEEACKDSSYVEGVNRSVERKEEGSTEKVINDICDGIRSAMSYVGAYDLKQFRYNARFIRITNNGKIENTPHF